MAKRQVQLQADLQTDEDFDLFLTNTGLLVVEVYSEWCGPCTGMVGTLRRVKFDKGDVITFAIAKSDTISYVNRFNKHSEPVWLFINNGRAHNLMFGADAPKLLKLIDEELQHTTKHFDSREGYAIAELQPEEIKRYRLKNEAKNAILLKERKERERQKIEYFQFVTDTIMESLPDIGVTIFGPQVHRDLFRKLIEFGAERIGIQCKDRRQANITKEQFEIINTVCKNPLPEDVIDALQGRELFAGFWKIDSTTQRTVTQTLELFEEEVLKPEVLPPDEYRETEEIQPALISPMKITVEYELPDNEECPHDSDFELEQEHKAKEHRAQSEMIQEDVEMPMEESEMGSEENDELPEDPVRESLGIGLIDIDIDDTASEMEEQELIEETPKKNICKKTITIPGIWVPKDARTHAALIYVLFPKQTASFLPPDPVPEPPHVIMAFNTYKQKDLLEFAERYKDDIPSYGYFTSDEAEEAELIANSKQKYAQVAHSASDKLVFKVNKRTSHTMLSLVSYGPTYVSFNTEVGKKEALKFFPEDYETAEQEMLKLKEEETRQKSKKGAKQPGESEALKKAPPEETKTEEPVVEAVVEPKEDIEVEKVDENAIQDGEREAAATEENAEEPQQTLEAPAATTEATEVAAVAETQEAQETQQAPTTNAEETQPERVTFAEPMKQADAPTAIETSA